MSPKLWLALSKLDSLGKPAKHAQQHGLSNALMANVGFLDQKLLDLQFLLKDDSKTLSMQSQGAFMPGLHQQWGTCTVGRQAYGLDIGSIKPWQTVLVGAVGLLALGKPVTGAQRFPEDFTLTLPGFKSNSLAQVSPSLSCPRASPPPCAFLRRQCHGIKPHRQPGVAGKT